MASLLCVINGIKNNSIGSTETQLESLDVLNKRCRMEVSGVRDRYAHLERCGYPGPQFQALERVWREESATEVVGEIFNPKPGHRFKVHPAVVDAGIQLCAFRLLGSNSSSAWQFTRVKTITFFPEETYHEDRALWVYSTCAKYASFVEQQDTFRALSRDGKAEILKAMAPATLSPSSPQHQRPEGAAKGDPLLF